jgi:hypothetical protein
MTLAERRLLRAIAYKLGLFLAIEEFDHETQRRAEEAQAAPSAAPPPNGWTNADTARHYMAQAEAQRRPK